MPPGDVTASLDPDTGVIVTSRATEYTETVLDMDVLGGCGFSLRSGYGVSHSDYYVHLSAPTGSGFFAVALHICRARLKNFRR